MHKNLFTNMREKEGKAIFKPTVSI